MGLLNRLNRVFNRNSVSDLKHIADAIDLSVNGVNEDLDKLKLQHNVNTSEGTWLEEWGKWFNVLRRNGEIDADYRARIIPSIITPKCTIPAIQSAVETFVLDIIGEEQEENLLVRIEEQYSNIFKYSVSQYSQSSRYQDGGFASRNTIDILIFNGVITSSLIDSINKIRAAGVKVFFTNVFSSSGDTQEIESLIPTYECELTMEYDNSMGVGILAGSSILLSDPIFDNDIIYHVPNSQALSRDSLILDDFVLNDYLTLQIRELFDDMGFLGFEIESSPV